MIISSVLLEGLSSRAKRAKPIQDIKFNGSDFVDMSMGSPSMDVLPLNVIYEAFQSRDVLLRGLKYAPDKGSLELIQILEQWLVRFVHHKVSTEQIMVTNGAQDALGLIADAFIDTNDVIIAESPTYWRASSIFYNVGADIQYVTVESDGIHIGLLEEKIIELISQNRRVKLLYTIPNYQNPTGAVLSAEKRQSLLVLSNKYGFHIIEDDVYAGLSYSGDLPPSIYSLSNGHSVIYTGSVTNLISPGLRIGWIVTNSNLIDQFTKLKRDSGTNPLASSVTSYLIENIEWDQYLSKLQNFYGVKLNYTTRLLATFPENCVTWKSPSGGFHLWIRLNKDILLQDFVDRCENEKVRVLPGTLCTGDGEQSKNAFRISFSFLTYDQIFLGMNRIKNVLMQYSELNETF